MVMADQIKAWREARGLSQAQAAERLGVPLRTLEGWEAGRSIHYAKVMSMALGAEMPLAAARQPISEDCFTEAVIQAGVKAWGTYSGMETKRSDLLRRMVRAMLKAMDGEAE